MASWNQWQGTAPSPYNSFAASPAPLPLVGQSSEEPRLQPQPHAFSHLQTTAPSKQYQVAYTNVFAAGPSQSNAAMNPNGNPSPPRQAWNPAQLLNPRGFQQSTPNPPPTMRIPYLSPDRPDPQASNLTVTGDSPGGPSNTPAHAHPPPQQFKYDTGAQNEVNGNGFAAYANGNGDMRGMGDMLERMHGVQSRDMKPQKRRKLHDEREDGNKATFSGGGKNGVLGDYMREKREEGKREANANGTRPPVTILDDDDDDEVQIIADSGDKEVCYGRIEGVEVNAHKVPMPRAGAAAIQEGYWPQVRVQLRRRQEERTFIIHVVDFSREIFGTIDVMTSRGLAPLLDSKFSLRTQGRILTRLKKEGDPEPGTSGVSSRYALDLNIYGPKKYALQVGRFLSHKNLFLRTPLLLEAGMVLHNPHTIEKPPQPPPRAAVSYGYRPQGPARSTEEIRADVLGMFDTLERSDDLPELDPDPRVLTELLRHQKQGLYFMTNKEKLVNPGGQDSFANTSLWKPMESANGSTTFLNVITGEEERKPPMQVLGGILADMMGLGKTLSILSLIIHTYDNEALDWAKLPPCNSQLNKDLCSTKKKGKAARRTVEQTPVVLNAKTTLLVSPLSIIANWEEQIKQHIKPGTLKYHIFHGANRIKDIRKLAEYDLVFTTYGTVASEFGSRSQQKDGVYPMEQINWFRIVLDEAHMIREQSTQQSKAICRLAANRRWAVTGTPVQNRLEDLGALMTFLRIKPFDEKGGFAQHIMAPFKMCDPSILPKLRLLVDSITLRRLKDRIDLPPRHDQLVKLDFSPEERAVYDVFAKNASDRANVIFSGRQNKLSGKSYVHILQSILRLRLICAHGRDLLGEEDLKVMQGLNRDSAIDLDSDNEDENDHGLSPKQAYDMYNLLKETNTDMCLTCQVKIGPNDVVDSDGEPKDEVIGYMTPCYHLICPACIDKYKADVATYANGNQQVGCPICQQWIKLSYFPLRQGGVDDEDESRQKLKSKAKPDRCIESYSGPHTKTKALIADLLASKQESESLPPESPIKSVVFSGWTSHLDLLQFAFQENGINYVRLDGKMSRAARGAAMEKFRENPSITVILVSITAGGLGLNLTTANKVYVMEPQYNPAAEAQAVDRVHRLGQKREVQTVRYIMNESFEEKMLVLQDKKKKLASLSMDREGKGRIDKEEAARKRLEDLRSLFK